MEMDYFSPPLGNACWYGDALKPGQRFWKCCSFNHSFVYCNITEFINSNSFLVASSEFSISNMSPQIEFSFFLSDFDAFYFFLAYFLGLWLQILYWIKVVRLGTLISTFLFLSHHVLCFWRHNLHLCILYIPLQIIAVIVTFVL